jgi:hypothetical protein
MRYDAIDFSTLSNKIKCELSNKNIQRKVTGVAARMEVHLRSESGVIGTVSWRNSVTHKFGSKTGVRNSGWKNE